MAATWQISWENMKQAVKTKAAFERSIIRAKSITQCNLARTCTDTSTLLRWSVNLNNSGSFKNKCVSILYCVTSRHRCMLGKVELTTWQLYTMCVKVDFHCRVIFTCLLTFTDLYVRTDVNLNWLYVRKLK